jgi:Tfp pilus assembly protein PilN
MRGQPDFSTAGGQTGSRAGGRLAVALGLLALALAAGSAWRARTEASAARERLAAVREEVKASTARLRSLEARSGAGDERLVRAEAAREATPMRIVADIGAVLPPDARLEQLSIEYGGDVSIEMQVLARDASAWDRLLAGMERAPRFRAVEPGPEDREGEVRSVVKARWSGSDGR